MADVTFEIVTTRDIGRQILRHRSFSFQEFSQRYADPTKDLGFIKREARLQDTKNRQNSVETDDEKLKEQWEFCQDFFIQKALESYEWAIEQGIAKEQARAILPEGLTLSRMYMKGSLRSWIHYCQVRCANGTQKEHMEIAREIWRQLCEMIPELRAIEIDGFSLEEYEIYANLNDILQKEIDKEVIEAIIKANENNGN